MGQIYLYTGTGGGKTTNALGLALRSVAHRKRVVIIQFLKWWKKTGEWKIREKLKPYYEIYQFGRRGWHGLKNLDERDKKLCKQGLELARKILKESPPFLLVLDEINLAVHCGMLEKTEVLELLKNLPKRTHVVLTGRYAPKEFYSIADYVNEIVDRKHPKKLEAIAGIQY
ncbi:MAG: cob(I)yrinic acid a,c-diamide adenosyltransferase [Candidatus Aenigmatarchaeota archaeon]|nr:MAG: cob(I)yrinic acid a,c-diamide adenosyltransferase [Candidatus Aenigmarchaeota archaeon]